MTAESGRNHPLDSPVWAALTTDQSALAVGEGAALRFPADISPFGACVDGSPEAVVALRDLIANGGNVMVMQRTPPQPPAGVTVTFSAEGVQMVATEIGRARAGVDPIELGEDDAAEMLALARLTRPGPFEARTHSMGRFLGVREAGELISMAGERLRPDGHCEISAVCTHPDYRGRGLGGALLAAAADRLMSAGVTPFLHAYADNAVAIALYERIGFRRRCGVVQQVWELAPSVAQSRESPAEA